MLLTVGAHRINHRNIFLITIGRICRFEVLHYQNLDIVIVLTILLIFFQKSWVDVFLIDPKRFFGLIVFVLNIIADGFSSQSDFFFGSLGAGFYF